MDHRHLVVDPGTPIEELGLAALDDLLERGDLTDWTPLLRVLKRDPSGAVATKVLHLVEHHPMYGTSPLLASWITSLRKTELQPRIGSALRSLRLNHGLTQREVADRLDATQPEISKLESRDDVRLSTARAYVAALGGRLVLVARFDGRDEELASAPRRSTE